MIITNAQNMSQASKDALAKIKAVRDPLDKMRDQLNEELNTHLESFKPKEQEIRARIKANNAKLYVADMDRSAIHKAQGIGMSGAVDAAVNEVAKKY